MSNNWEEVKPEKTREIYLKSQPGKPLLFHNVTHFKKRDTGCMFKCDEGIVYFERDDISLIISDTEDWVV